MSGFGQSVVLMFQSFGFSMQGYGVWAPVMFVVGLGVALLVGYLFFTFIDASNIPIPDLKNWIRMDRRLDVKLMIFH